MHDHYPETAHETAVLLMSSKTCHNGKLAHAAYASICLQLCMLATSHTSVELLNAVTLVTPQRVAVS